MLAVCNIYFKSQKKCTFMTVKLYPDISGWPTITLKAEEATQPKICQMWARTQQVVAAPAITTQSVSKREMSSLPWYLYLNNSHGLEMAVASGSGLENLLTRALECWVVLKELLKSTSPVGLRIGISCLESAHTGGEGAWKPTKTS